MRVEAGAAAAERGGEVEAKAVDVHLLHPVAQRVQDQSQGLGAVRVDGVPGPRVVDVAAAVLGQAVVGAVVEPAEAQRRPLFVSLGGVVEDHVEDHLEPGGVQRFDHRLELVDLVAAIAARRVLVVGREEADRLVAPVVAEPPGDQRTVVNELMDRQQLDRGHPEPGQVIDHRGFCQPRVRAAEPLRHVGVQLGESLDVQLVDDRILDRCAGWAIVAPIELPATYDRPGHVRSRVRRIIALKRGIPAHRAGDGACVRVEKKLRGVAPGSGVGIPCAVHAKAVARSMPDAVDVRSPHVSLVGFEGSPGFSALVVEEAQLDRLGDATEHGEAGPIAVGPSPEGNRGHGGTIYPRRGHPR